MLSSRMLQAVRGRCPVLCTQLAQGWCDGYGKPEACETCSSSTTLPAAALASLAGVQVRSWLVPASICQACSLLASFSADPACAGPVASCLLPLYAEF